MTMTSRRPQETRPVLQPLRDETRTRLCHRHGNRGNAFCHRPRFMEKEDFPILFFNSGLVFHDPLGFSSRPSHFAFHQSLIYSTVAPFISSHPSPLPSRIHPLLSPFSDWSNICSSRAPTCLFSGVAQQWRLRHPRVCLSGWGTEVGPGWAGPGRAEPSNSNAGRSCSAGQTSSRVPEPHTLWPFSPASAHSSGLSGGRWQCQECLVLVPLWEKCYLAPCLARSHPRCFRKAEAVWCEGSLGAARFLLSADSSQSNPKESHCLPTGISWSSPTSLMENWMLCSGVHLNDQPFISH